MGLTGLTYPPKLDHGLDGKFLMEKILDTHEVVEHHPAAGSLALSLSWSYGHFVSGVNETVMSVSRQAPRALHYSNPDVPFLGTNVPSGTNLRWNARAGAALAPSVSEFRDPQLLDLIFRSGFEALPLDL